MKPYIVVKETNGVSNIVASFDNEDEMRGFVNWIRIERSGDDVARYVRVDQPVSDSVEPDTQAPKGLRLTPVEFNNLRATQRPFTTDTSGVDRSKPYSVCHYLPNNEGNTWAIQAIEDLRRREAVPVESASLMSEARSFFQSEIGSQETIARAFESPIDKFLREAPAIIEKMMADMPTLHDKFMLAAVTGLCASGLYARDNATYGVVTFATRIATAANTIACESINARAKSS